MMIQLGAGVFLKGRLSVASADLCVEAFKNFKRTMTDFKVNRIVAFGTAALREAKDSERLIRRIHKEAGIKIRIIPGDEEARLIARGVLKNEVGLRGAFAIIDIGGGSTEVIACQSKKVVARASFELGTARLQQVFLKSSPPKAEPGKPSPIEDLRRHIRGSLLYRVVSENWPRSRRILGSSGTVKAILKIIKRRTSQSYIDPKSLRDLVNEMSTMKKSQLLRIPGMESNRVDMILSGAILLEECVNAFKTERVEPTEFSLRDGILDEQVEILKSNRHLLQQDPIDDLFETAKDLGGKPDELNLALKVSDDVFERLKPIHKLNGNWKIYLHAGALLHDCGKSISAINSSEHSAYVARFADIPRFEDWESEFIAQLCLRAKSGKVQKKDLPFKGDRLRQRAFIKVLALLRLVAALSFQRSRSIPIERVRVDGARVIIQIPRRSKASLQILLADPKKNLFEDVFKKSIHFELV